MKQGYLGIFRKFFNEHEFWKEKRKYSKAEAWIDLMQSARYGEEPETLFDKRGSYILEYGDVYISLRYLGERWQWSKNKVQGFLAYLEKRESILVKKRDSHRTIIHIANLKGYTEWIKGERDSEGTVKGQSRDSEGTKKKKVNKEKNEKKKTYGIFNNVKLTDEELSKLKEKFSDYTTRIEKLGEYIKSRGVRYKCHYATILTWARKDKSGGKVDGKYTGLDEKNYRAGVGEDGSF
ncbi:hypothetical protein KAR91_58545 [Candidatus Pacearchaeota archaeon]|nr:hypothetical protein [Candidatus Pacearchaeota archaeon]